MYILCFTSHLFVSVQIVSFVTYSSANVIMFDGRAFLNPPVKSYESVSVLGNK